MMNKLKIFNGISNNKTMVNLLIWISDCKEPLTPSVDTLNNYDNDLYYSDIAYISLLPDDLKRLGFIKKDYQYFDPIIGLSHEIMHVIRENYNFSDEQYNMVLEENTVFGLSILDNINKKNVKKSILNSLNIIKIKYHNELEKGLNKICNILNKKLYGKKDELSKKFLKIYKRKYFFNTNDEEKLKVTDIQIKSLYNMLCFNLSEVNICKEFNVNPRRYYGDPVGFSHIEYYIDVSDASSYSIKNGILINGKKAKKHPLSYNGIITRRIRKIPDIIDLYLRNDKLDIDIKEEILLDLESEEKKDYKNIEKYEVSINIDVE